LYLVNVVNFMNLTLKKKLVNITFL
jgi:hypothetical protein